MRHPRCGHEATVGPSVGGKSTLVVVVSVASNCRQTRNELRTIFATMDLAIGRNAIVSVNTTRPDPANEGKTAPVIGHLISRKPAADATLGVSGDYASLHRIVQMNQWILIPRRRSASTHTQTANGFELRWSPLEPAVRHPSNGMPQWPSTPGSSSPRDCKSAHSQSVATKSHCSADPFQSQSPHNSATLSRLPSRAIPGH